jgi:hypothetical protein
MSPDGFCHCDKHYCGECFKNYTICSHFTIGSDGSGNDIKCPKPETQTDLKLEEPHDTPTSQEDESDEEAETPLPHTIRGIEELAFDRHDPSLKELPHVYQLWADGWISRTKGGDLFDERTKFTEKISVIGRPLFVFPIEQDESSYAIMKREDAVEIRQLMKRVVGWNEDFEAGDCERMLFTTLDKVNDNRRKTREEKRSKERARKREEKDVSEVEHDRSNKRKVCHDEGL